MTTIKILGIGDLKTKALRDNLTAALHLYPLQSKVLEVCEVQQIAASGISKTPALILDNQVVVEGEVPTVEEISRLLRNRMLYRSKLYRLRKIMVPVDFSPSSALAFRLAWRIAQQFDATIDLVHVMDSIFDGGTASPSGFLSNYLHTTEQELETFAAQVLQKEGVEWKKSGDALPDEPGPRVRAKVQFGFPESVLEEASTRYDLMVMGTTGKGNLASKVFGTISTALSKNAHCPVLLVPQGAEVTAFKDVLYTSNFESNDPEKIRQVVSFTNKFGAQLHFVHVGESDEPNNAVEQQLFKINYKYADAKKPFIYVKVLGTDPAEQLRRYAIRHKADLMVLVTHRRGFWGNLLHRSTTKEVILNTKIPILVVHQFNDIIHN